MSKKTRVLVLFGGRSGEHEVSLQSAASIISAMDPNVYEVIPMAINQQGEWLPGERAVSLLEGKLDVPQLEGLKKGTTTSLISQGKGKLPTFSLSELDVVFPVLHGTYGEDGTVQGLLELADVAYVGAGVMASAVGMDKVMMKKVFAQEGLPQGNFTFFLRRQIEQDLDQVVAAIEEKFSYPCFIKPANLGSSVGISKAKDREGLITALNLAAQYDRKVIVEEFIQGREIEVAVLGNEEPIVSVPGEIIPSNEFYDYRAKYIDGKSQEQIPANLSKEATEKVRQLAIQCFKAIDGSGLARVDFFVTKDEKIYVNEINTMPGFTPYSMYAKLWEYSGIPYSELISRLIELAKERYREKKKLITTYKVE